MKVRNGLALGADALGHDVVAYLEREDLRRQPQSQQRLGYSGTAFAMINEYRPCISRHRPIVTDDLRRNCADRPTFTSPTALFDSPR
jgi:hypothetical protein